MNLDFLKNVKLAPVNATENRKTPSVPSLPEKADLRVFPNGKVYPSEDFAKKFALEFTPKVNEAPDGADAVFEIQGNGLDIFSTLAWGMMSAARASGALESEFLCVSVVPKRAAKVDMWSSTKYEDNIPKASVFTQGSNTFAKKQLVPMIAEVYGVDWDATIYVDLSVAHDTPIVSESGIYHIPKIVSTGANKGNSTYIRRENITVNPLVVVEVKSLEVKPEEPKDVIGVVGSPEKTSTEELANGDNTSSAPDAKEDWAAKLGQKSEA